MGRLIVMAVSLALVVAACGSDNGSDWGACPVDGCSLSVTPAVSYTPTHQLDVLAPEGSGPWPTVVLVHGSQMSRLSLNRLAEAISSSGAVVFNISTPTAAPYLDTIEHVACAVRFARAETLNYGGSPERLVLAGYSLGAATGAIVGLGGDGLDPDCEVSSGSSEPDAFVGYEGPYDVALNAYEIDPTDLQADSPDVWTEINPYSHVGNNPDLIVRLIHGTDEDQTIYDVRPSVSEDFEEALRSGGYDVALIVIADATHADAFRSGTEAFNTLLAQVIAIARNT